MSRGVMLGAVCVVGLNVVAADWPQWRGLAGTGYIPTGEFVPEKLPAAPKTEWRFPLGDGYGSVAVAGGRVFVLDKGEGKELLHAVDAKSGKELWKHALDEAYDDFQGKGPRSTPLVDGDRLYVQSCRGELHCVNVASGAVIWRKNFVKDFGALFYGETKEFLANGASRHGNCGSPAIEGENIIVQAGGTNGASVVCLKKKTGELVWKSQNDQSGYAGTVVTNIAGIRQAVVFTADGVIGLDIKDGKLLWRFPIQTKFARHATTPVVVGDMVMVSSHEHGLFGIRVTKAGQGMKAEQAWLNKQASINFASPVAVGTHVYGLGPAKNVFCADVKTGAIAWSKDGFITGAAGKAHAGFLVGGQSIFFLTDGGQFIQIAADPKECREISRTQVSGLTWNIPAYADGKLYLRDAKNLLAVSLK
ncbi:MAG: PQQ-binding-like beta-propeller repeat protein [Verrucomicrobiota bacterium]